MPQHKKSFFGWISFLGRGLYSIFSFKGGIFLLFVAGVIVYASPLHALRITSTYLGVSLMEFGSFPNTVQEGNIFDVYSHEFSIGVFRAYEPSPRPKKKKLFYSYGSDYVSFEVAFAMAEAEKQRIFYKTGGRLTFGSFALMFVYGMGVHAYYGKADGGEEEAFVEAGVHVKLGLLYVTGLNASVSYAKLLSGYEDLSRDQFLLKLHFLHFYIPLVMGSAQ